MTKKLFEPLNDPKFIPLRNRTVMSAMSRGGATPEHFVTDAMLEYYHKRAAGGAGLILTEGTLIDKSGDGWNNAPYIASAAHAESWRPTIEAVHAEGAAIACQLWHCGRISHSDYTGDAPVSSTNRAAAGMNRQNGKPYGEPRALDTEEMPTVYGYYADAAQRALDVGFDADRPLRRLGREPLSFRTGTCGARSRSGAGQSRDRAVFSLTFHGRRL
jgi:N-ethylmaleimide reductase